MFISKFGLLSTFRRQYPSRLCARFLHGTGPIFNKMGITSEDIKIPMSDTINKETIHINDTNQFKKLLTQDSNFTVQQANCLINILSQCIQTGMVHVSKDLAKRERLIQLTYQQRVDFANLKEQLLKFDNNEFQRVHDDMDTIQTDFLHAKNRLRDKINTLNAGTKLDLSLEKGRIHEEISQFHIKVNEIDSKIEQEVSNMKVQINQVKTQVMQWLFGACTGTFALVLAYIRLLS